MSKYFNHNQLNPYEHDPMRYLRKAKSSAELSKKAARDYHSGFKQFQMKEIGDIKDCLR